MGTHRIPRREELQRKGAGKDGGEGAGQAQHEAGGGVGGVELDAGAGAGTTGCLENSGWPFLTDHPGGGGSASGDQKWPSIEP